MDRRQVCEFLVKNESGPGELMAYADHGEAGCVAIGPDGKKYRFDAAYLAQAAAKAIAAAKAHAPKPDAEPAKPVKRKPKPRRSTAKRQAATGKKASK